MSEKTDKFIQTLAPIARNEYLSREKWVLPSVCIAIGALESGWNLNAKTLFGIKGTGYTATTSEYLNGHYETITTSFKTYPNISSAVVGFYDLITKNKRYTSAVNNSDYKSAVNAIKHGGYATDPNYVSKVVSIIEQYGLTKYDSREEKKTNEQIAEEVIAGKWGNGSDRVTRLTNAGYDSSAVQSIVNYKLGTTKSKSYNEVAKEVIRGEWGNGTDRKTRLAQAGYDYNKVQSLVNSMLK